MITNAIAWHFNLFSWPIQGIPKEAIVKAICAHLSPNFIEGRLNLWRNVNADDVFEILPDIINIQILQVFDLVESLSVLV